MGFDPRRDQKRNERCYELQKWSEVWTDGGIPLGFLQRGRVKAAAFPPLAFDQPQALCPEEIRCFSAT